MLPSLHDSTIYSWTKIFQSMKDFLPLPDNEMLENKTFSYKERKNKSKLAYQRNFEVKNGPQNKNVQQNQLYKNQYDSE